MPADTLEHHLLIATPALEDPRFYRTVIYVCAHTAEHAMGLVINTPLADLRLDDLLPAVGLDAGHGHTDFAVMSGGPVDCERGFVLHTDDMMLADASVQMGPGVALTATREALLVLASDDRPALAAFFLGYAGWGAGQLDAELSKNAWLVAPASMELLFGPDHDSKWHRALRSIGVDPDRLSRAAGRA